MGKVVVFFLSLCSLLACHNGHCGKICEEVFSLSAEQLYQPLSEFEAAAFKKELKGLVAKSSQKIDQIYEKISAGEIEMSIAKKADLAFILQTHQEALNTSENALQESPIMKFMVRLVVKQFSQLFEYIDMFIEGYSLRSAYEPAPKKPPGSGGRGGPLRIT